MKRDFEIRSDQARRTSRIRSRARLGLYVCIGAIWSSSAAGLIASGQDVAAPDHPLFTSPIQEAVGYPWDVQSLRIHVFIDPESHELRGQAEIDLLTNAELPDSSLIAASGLTITQYIVRSSAADSSVTRNNVRVEYRIDQGLHTFPLGDQNGPWSAVWTSFDPGSINWIPFNITLDDWFLAEIRVSLPTDWRVFLTGTEQWNVEDGAFRSVASLHANEVAIRKLGFAAFRGSVISTEEGEYVIANGAVREGPTSVMRISIARMEQFFANRLGMSEPDSSKFIVFSGPRNVSSSGAGITLLPLNGLPTGLMPAEEDFHLAKAVASRWISERLSLAGWTDIWIYEALSAYMAALYVRDRHGEAAYLHIVWNRRSEYLEESSVYVRPLVWDRWTHPSELLDAHAEGKGLWIFHMLGEIHGTEFVWNALQLLAIQGQSEPISTEELRVALEASLELELGVYFDQWVYAAGHPVLDLSYQTSADQQSVQLTISQTQSGYLVPSAFSLQLVVESASLVGVDRDEFLIDEPTTTVSLPVDLRPQYVLLDPDGLHLFEYGATLDPNALVSSLRRNETIVGRYVGSRRLLETAVDPSMMIALRPILQERTSPYVDGILLELMSRMAPSSSAFREIIAVARDTTARSRATAIEKLGLFSGSEEARRVAFDAANTESNPLVLAAAVSALIRLDSTLAWPVLRSAFVTKSTGEIVRRRAVSILKDAPITETQKLDALLDLLGDEYPDNLRIEAIGVLHSWVNTARVLQPVLSLWPKASGQLRAAIVDFLDGSLLSRDDSKRVSAWIAVEPDPVLQLRLRATLAASSG